ncbi:hypothetical protein [Streptomyces sp. TLI_171]|uniref:hypothetical protein n=1 Tax=Streptomyces sp. TLI_171 TaxID=1938859 RepID=UPI00117F5301|nr:hypothetical protein [Streptomyces sp. TLI_171]
MSSTNSLEDPMRSSLVKATTATFLAGLALLGGAGTASAHHMAHPHGSLAVGGDAAAIGGSAGAVGGDAWAQDGNAGAIGGDAEALTGSALAVGGDALADGGDALAVGGDASSAQ